MKIYIAAHKPARVPLDNIYVPIQVGQGPGFAEVRDNVGDHIAGKNASFCELTALYWIWKNDTEKIQGLVHYRRYFGKRTRDPWEGIAGEETLDKLLENHDLILPKKRHYFIETNYSQYSHAHHEKDLILTRQVLGALHPGSLPAFDRVMARRSGHRFNMLIAHREVLAAYCQWLFPVLFALEEKVDIKNYDAYNRRVFGFLGERLLDVWLEDQVLRVAELPVIHTDGINWLRKGSQFLLRKFKRR